MSKKLLLFNIILCTGFAIAMNDSESESSTDEDSVAMPQVTSSQPQDKKKISPGRTLSMSNIPPVVDKQGAPVDLSQLQSAPVSVSPVRSVSMPSPRVDLSSSPRSGQNSPRIVQRFMSIQGIGTPTSDREKSGEAPFRVVAQLRKIMVRLNEVNSYGAVSRADVNGIGNSIDAVMAQFDQLFPFGQVKQDMDVLTSRFEAGETVVNDLAATKKSLSVLITRLEQWWPQAQRMHPQQLRASPNRFQVTNAQMTSDQGAKGEQKGANSDDDTEEGTTN